MTEKRREKGREGKGRGQMKRGVESREEKRREEENRTEGSITRGEKRKANTEALFSTVFSAQCFPSISPWTSLHCKAFLLLPDALLSPLIQGLSAP